MTPEEKENMALTIENAMLKGFEKFAETIDSKIANDIAAHKQTCGLSAKSNGSFSDNLKDWKSIAACILGIAWVLSTVITVLAGKPLEKFTPEQIKQIAQQVQEVPNPIIITDEKK
jgi:hypothetical protein